MKRLPTIFALLGLLAAFPAPSFSFAEELPVHGFVELAVGGRTGTDNAAYDDLLLAEARAQFDLLWENDDVTFQLRTDLIHDTIDSETRVEVREASLLLFPTDSVDLKLGRQVLTWGTGDLVFLNDLFPKDWRSFFIGRDDEYLKHPSDAARSTWFGDTFNVDLVWAPVFTVDEYISGERLSYYSPSKGGLAGPRDPEIDAEEPGRGWGAGRFAGRVYANFGGWETAVYTHRGFWGQPKGFDPTSGEAYFPRLEAWGASTRGALLGGIANTEVALYRSLDDKTGDDPYVPNDELRFLLGFSRELIAEQNLGLQVYLERLLNYDEYTRAGGEQDQNRWWLTGRYTGMFMQQNLTLSLFIFYSPNERDGYARPKVSYKFSDNLAATLGGNLFWGKHEDTFFGQFTENTNLYTRVRYTF